MKKYIFLIMLVSIPAIYHLLGSGYHSMHDDLQVMRIFQMEKCFADGQIPCRWSPDMVYGYGQAMFNFYSAFPYYLGALISFTGLVSILTTVKLLFIIALVGSGIGMFVLVRDIWGEKAAFLAAVAYLYAPYHALDIIVRGALAESFSLAILPFLLHAICKVVKNPSFPSLAYLAITFAALLTTHNISTFLYAVPVCVWTLYWLIRNGTMASIVTLAGGGLLGIMLAGFFILPVIFEKSLFQSELFIQGYSFYESHFVSFGQLFLERSWGHGPSVPGAEDDLSFQIGVLHWLLGIAAAAAALVAIAKKDFSNKPVLVIVCLSIAAIAALFTHHLSAFLWERISLLQFTQFPWRFLGLVIFFLSFAIGYLATIWKMGWPLVSVLTIAMVLLNFQYFEPLYRWPDLTEEQKLSGDMFELQQMSAITDYLPRTANTVPPKTAPRRPEILSGDATVSEIEVRSNVFEFEAAVTAPATVRIPILFFPGWKVYVNGEEVPVQIKNDFGAMEVRIPPGDNRVTGRFTNTPVRTVGNWLTVLAVLLLLAAYYHARTGSGPGRTIRAAESEKEVPANEASDQQP